MELLNLPSSNILRFCWKEKHTLSGEKTLLKQANPFSLPLLWPSFIGAAREIAETNPKLSADIFWIWVKKPFNKPLFLLSTMHSTVTVIPLNYHPYCTSRRSLPLLTRHMYALFVAVMYEMLQCTEGGWSLSGESRSLDKTRRLTTWAQQLRESRIYRTYREMSDCSEIGGYISGAAHLGYSYNTPSLSNFGIGLSVSTFAFAVLRPPPHVTLPLQSAHWIDRLL